MSKRLYLHRKKKKLPNLDTIEEDMTQISTEVTLFFGVYMIVALQQCSGHLSPVQYYALNIGIISKNTSHLETELQDVGKGIISNVTYTLSFNKPKTDNPFKRFVEECSFIANENVTILVREEHSCGTTWGSSVSSLPIITVTPKMCVKKPHPSTLSIMAAPNHVVHVILALADSQNWPNIICMLEEDSEESLEVVDSLIQKASNWPSKFSVYSIDSHDESRIEMILKESSKSLMETIPFLLVASHPTVTLVLKKAAKIHMRMAPYFWLIYGRDVDVARISSLRTKRDNIVMVQQETDLSDTMTALFDAISISKAALHSLTHNNSSSVHQSAVTDGKCRNKFSGSSNRAVSEALKKSLKTYEEAKRNSSETEYVVYNSAPAKGMQLVGKYQSNGELQMKTQLYPSTVNGQKFIISTLQYSFFQRKTKKPDGSVKWEGLTFELLDELANELNFTYEVVEPEDGMWGIIDDSGNWNGMIAQVINKSVDFAAACFSITAAREEVVDFAQPYFHEESAVIMSKPTNNDRAVLYLKPFKKEVWMLHTLAIFLSAVALWFFTMRSPFYKPSVMENTSNGLSKICNALLDVYGASMQQGGRWLPASQSGRILVGCMWFFEIVIVATYTGNLIAFLAISTLELPFNSLTGMILQSRMEWGTADGVALVMLFREAKFDPYYSVYKGMTTVGSYSEGLKRVKEGDYAFIAEKSWYQAVSAGDCSLAMIDETFYPTSYGWAFQPNSPFLSIFNDKINKLREAGILEHWIQKWTPRNLNCTGLRPVTKATVVTLVDFQGALYVLAFGLLVSAITLWFEWLLRWFNCHPVFSVSKWTVLFKEKQVAQQTFDKKSSSCVNDHLDKVDTGFDGMDKTDKDDSNAV